eukprot:1146984-Pelagomonas_calceolata.AAC.3
MSAASWCLWEHEIDNAHKLQTMSKEEDITVDKGKRRLAGNAQGKGKATHQKERRAASSCICLSLTMLCSRRASKHGI